MDSLLSAWENTRLTFTHKVEFHHLNDIYNSLPYSQIWLVGLFQPGAAHSSSTPDPDCPGTASFKPHDPPLIFDLEDDPSENYPLSLKDQPHVQAVLEEILKVKADFEATMVFGESQVSKGTDPALEPCCNPECSPKPSCCHCWRDRRWISECAAELTF